MRRPAAILAAPSSAIEGVARARGDSDERRPARHGRAAPGQGICLRAARHVRRRPVVAGPVLRAGRPVPVARPFPDRVQPADLLPQGHGEHQRHEGQRPAGRTEARLQRRRRDLGGRELVPDPGRATPGTRSPGSAACGCGQRPAERRRRRRRAGRRRDRLALRRLPRAPRRSIPTPARRLLDREADRRRRHGRGLPGPAPRRPTGRSRSR